MHGLSESILNKDEDIMIASEQSRCTDENASFDENALFEELSRLAKPAAHEALWLGKPAPRYTSYPPATCFSERVSSIDYSRALSILPSHDPISIYTHIPFCRALCLYCGCNTCITQDDLVIQTYMNAMKREIELVVSLSAQQKRIKRLHLGGGSPNILSPRAIEDLFTLFRRSFSFSTTDEVAVELDPRLVTFDQIQALASNGVTRVSLGIQDLNPDVQRIIRREQSFESILRVCVWLRAAGITQINFDLIYGLPLQTPQSMVQTALQIIRLQPSRIALYSYAHLPQIKKHQKALEASVLPGKHTLLALDDAARKTFLHHGYVQIGMDHFARSDDALSVASQEGRLHRNFQGYTDDAPIALLGFGASAISQTRDGYFQNEREPRFYQKTLTEGHDLPIVRGIKLSGEDRVRAAIIEKFMCTMSCHIDSVCRAHNFSIASFAPEFEALKPFEAAGLISRQGFSIKLETRHRMAIRVIAQIFDKAKPPSDTIYSSTG